MNAINLSITTVTYFSDIPDLRVLFSSVQKASEYLFQHTGITVDYFVVDNSLDEQYFSRLKRLCSEYNVVDMVRFHLSDTPVNAGYGGGNNSVINDISSSYHLILNPDVELRADTLFQAVEYVQANADVAMLTPKVLGEGDHHAAKVYPDCFTLLLRYFNFNFLNSRYAERLSRYQCDQLAGEADKSVELAGGCFLFLRAGLFKQIGGFDEHFFMYFEDYDLSIRVREFGAIAYVPSVEIRHSGGGVGGKAFRHHCYFSISAIKFFFRHGWRLW